MAFYFKEFSWRCSYTFFYPCLFMSYLRQIVLNKCKTWIHEFRFSIGTPKHDTRIFQTQTRKFFVVSLLGLLVLQASPIASLTWETLFHFYLEVVTSSDKCLHWRILEHRERTFLIHPCIEEVPQGIEMLVNLTYVYIQRVCGMW